MSNKEILIAIIIITLGIVSTSVYKTYVENEKDTRLAEIQNDDRKDDRKAILEAMHFADDDDKKKAKLFKDTVKHNDLAGAIPGIPEHPDTMPIGSDYYDDIGSSVVYGIFFGLGALFIIIYAFSKPF